MSSYSLDVYMPVIILMGIGFLMVVGAILVGSCLDLKIRLSSN